jgi:hypothetical protein
MPLQDDFRARGWVRTTFHNSQWWERYNLLEFVVQQATNILDRGYPQAKLVTEINRVLERELAGYRFINDRLVPITSDAEARAIEESLTRARSTGLGGVAAHLDEALKKLSAKPEPDYRNAIKEAISAVESAAKVIARDEKADLDEALDALQTVSPMHGALVSACKKAPPTEHLRTSHNSGWLWAPTADSNDGLRVTGFYRRGSRLAIARRAACLRPHSARSYDGRDAIGPEETLQSHD